MAEITILQLSDLHLDSSNTKDLQMVLNALWKDLKTSKEIDFIVFTGDLVMAGDDKDSFREAYSVFIEPLLRKTNVDKDRFFIVPGNHDIQRGAIDYIIEAGLREMLTSPDRLNSFFDEEVGNGFKHIERLDNFMSFKSANIGIGYMVISNKLFSIHVVPIKSMSVGFACLNSAWRATGKGKDYDRGKLLIGERQVTSCLSHLHQCDLKIALHHHPLDWLMGYDQESMEATMFREFDFIFCGHLHKGNIKRLQTLEGRTVVIPGGAIYQNSTHYNGYSMLSIDPQKGIGELRLRTYYKDRNLFDKATDRCHEGKIDLIWEKNSI